ncbi:hypothetical protein HYV73_04395 [Candidatus Uhrbacteria bacterium]|nr:hypothetical protein [Candidatus Uhrbacteria bacterium]
MKSIESKPEFMSHMAEEVEGADVELWLFDGEERVTITHRADEKKFAACTAILFARGIGRGDTLHLVDPKTGAGILRVAPLETFHPEFNLRLLPALSKIEPSHWKLKNPESSSDAEVRRGVKRYPAGKGFVILAKPGSELSKDPARICRLIGEAFGDRSSPSPTTHPRSKTQGKRGDR